MLVSRPIQMFVIKVPIASEIPGEYKKDFQSWKNRGFCTGKIHKFLGKSQCSNAKSTSGVYCADSDPEEVLNHPMQGFIVFYARVKPISFKYLPPGA